MVSPEKFWWKPLGRLERNWLLIAFVWCVALTAMMPIWFYFGRQNVPATTYRTTPDQFKTKVEAFVAEYATGEEINSIPVVAPPSGDVYMWARQWQWYPILELVKGEEYRIHVSSLDVQHGFSIQPVNLNFQILPGYDYVITLTPTTSGEFTIVCNEYCLIGHHTMVGRIFVNDN
jgi:cytochrome c oxidase subunit II